MPDITVRRWIAWKPAELSCRVDPTAHYEQKIELVDIEGRVHQTIWVAADAYGAGVSSSASHPQSGKHLPGYMRVTDDDGTEW